jgi:hypothetical protein
MELILLEGLCFMASVTYGLKNTIFFDSQPKPLGSNDRYSYLFARGKSPSKDIQIITVLSRKLAGLIANSAVGLATWQRHLLFDTNA